MICPTCQPYLTILVILAIINFITPPLLTFYPTPFVHINPQAVTLPSKKLVRSANIDRNLLVVCEMYLIQFAKPIRKKKKKNFRSCLRLQRKSLAKRFFASLDSQITDPQHFFHIIWKHTSPTQYLVAILYYIASSWLHHVNATYTHCADAYIPTLVQLHHIFVVSELFHYVIIPPRH